MSKIKSRWWNFIESEDYERYNLKVITNGDCQGPYNGLQADFIVFEDLGTTDVRKRLEKRFKKFKSQNK